VQSLFLFFEHLLGKYKRVEEFDEFGQAWLRFKIRKGPHAGYPFSRDRAILAEAAPGRQVCDCPTGRRPNKALQLTARYNASQVALFLQLEC